MTIQTLSAKGTRRIARETGIPTITRAWVDNEADHHLVLFATWDHLHGWYDRRTGETEEQTADEDVRHLPSCLAQDGTLLVELEPFDDDGRWPTLRS